MQTLLFSLKKVFERIVFKALFAHLSDNNILTPLQSGFVPGDSAVNQLVHLYDFFCKAIDSGKEVRAIFCDISKAFDRVWHRGLILKLHSAGIRGNLLIWFENYLSERKQRVILPHAESDLLILHAGVPQGSILGPLLFLLFINDIVVGIESSIRLFADDTSLYIQVQDPNSAADILNRDMTKVSEWADRWLVSFNPTKTESMLLSRHPNKYQHPSILYNGQNISEVTSHKHLGLLLSSNCTWSNHLDRITTKAWTRLNVMRKLQF